MSSRAFDRSPDLRQLHADCYAISLSPGGLLLIDGVPYVTPSRTIAFGRLISSLALAGEQTVNPVEDHSVYFAGEATPCDQQGAPLQRVIIQEGAQPLEAGLTATHRFSCRPADNTKYADYHAKMTAYVAILLSHVRALDPAVRATRDRPVALGEDDPDAPFMYLDTASSRAGIGVISDKLATRRVAIVGVGGTGSYILDLVAKTRVREIHLFDGDVFLDHNAFRSPGAATLDELNLQENKARYFAERYSKIKRGIVAHPYDVDASTVGELREMDFVFLAAEGGDSKRLVVDELEAAGVPFIDVGLGVTRSDDTLGGIVCVTTSTAAQREQARGHIDLSPPADDDIYDENIQLAELNALNAVLAVIRWKKLCGFYRDYTGEHFSAYTIDTNRLISAARECRSA